MSRIVTVGTFDGVHRGHDEVLRALQREASRRGMEPMVITFDNHPLQVVAPERAPKQLMPAADKMKALSRYGVQTRLLHFDRELCGMTAAEWLARLHDRYDVRALVLGHDNTFGSDGRHLTHADYHIIGHDAGVLVLDAPVLPGISSSAIRHALTEGNVEAAASMLGRQYEVSGRVAHGRALGRTIGFPTANLDIDPARQLPARGVYAVDVLGLPDSTTRRGVLNIGCRPTVGGDAPSVECHVIDYDGNLYGNELTVRFLRRLRDERRFAGLDELKEAIGCDVAIAREN